MPPRKPARSANVQKVIETLKKDPRLVKKMNEVLAEAYKEAEVTLTQGEKAELFSSLAPAIKNKAVTGL